VVAKAAVRARAMTGRRENMANSRNWQRNSAMGWILEATR
jgi:hypothetical protein